MSREGLITLLLRLAIAFVALEIAGVVVVFGLFAFVALGGDMPMDGGSRLRSGERPR
jgi:hypothetical protein